MRAKQVLEILGYHDGVFDRLADAVKDALLDWELTPSGNDGSLPDDLLPMSPPLFVEELRPRVEEVLRRLAAAINEVPPDQAADLLQGPVAALFADLLRAAVLRGLQLRLEATEATLTSTHLPEGDWAKRYRRMRADLLEPKSDAPDTSTAHDD